MLQGLGICVNKLKIGPACIHRIFKSKSDPSRRQWVDRLSRVSAGEPTRSAGKMLKNCGCGAYDYPRI